jgi:hypothetical protein
MEVNQTIWAWHHLEGKPPAYEVPVVEQIGDPEWSGIVSSPGDATRLR